MKGLRRFTRKDGFSEIDLIHSAIDHLRSAKILFKESPLCFDSAGYLSHLGIELLLKAILLNKTDKFCNIHSLSTLSHQIEKLNYTIDQNKILIKVDSFNELRYPKVSAPIEIETDDWCQIESLFEFLISMFPKDIQRQVKNMDDTDKGNRVLLKKSKRKTTEAL